MNKEEYTYLQLDLLKELANIGGGNSATSISQIIDKPVEMSVPTIDILTYEEIYKKIMSAGTVVNGIILRMLGDGEGIFLYIIEEKSADKLASIMVPNGIQVDEEIRISAIKELVNILVNSFLNALSKFMDANLITSIPLLAKDSFGAILSSVYIESGQYDEDVMIIKNEFFYLGEKIESSLYFIPKPGLLDKLFKIMGM